MSLCGVMSPLLLTFKFIQNMMDLTEVLRWVQLLVRCKLYFEVVLVQAVVIRD